MREVEVPLTDGSKAGIDLCERCGSVFVEFFDGEPVEISRVLSGHLAAAAAIERPAVLLCPDCQKEMVLRPYLDTGPEVARCESCLALFATPDDLRALCAIEVEEAEPSWLTRTVLRLRSLFDPTVLWAKTDDEER
jgi:hypothetical protein